MPLPPLSDFHADLRAFAEEHVPADYRGFYYVSEDEYPATIQFNRRFAELLAERGLLVPGWPVEHGGQGLPFLRQMEIAEEMAYWLEPRGAFYMAVNWIGPVLIRFGSVEQQRRHLPPIARAETLWCEGFSERNAGSDLAAAATKATPVAEGYKITGHKIWISYADHAEWCILVARTFQGERRHDGLSLLLVPMDTPGITVRPIPACFGAHLNEVFFDDALVGEDSIVGEPGQAWGMITGSLDLERIDTLSYAECQRVVDEIAQVLGSRISGAVRRTARLRLADISASILAARYLIRRLNEEMDRGTVVSHECSAAKIYLSELYERTANMARSILGDAACLHSSAGNVPLKGHIDRMLRWCKTGTIAAGANEIQRTIIATRGLGLPRG